MAVLDRILQEPSVRNGAKFSIIVFSGNVFRSLPLRESLPPVYAFFQRTLD